MQTIPVLGGRYRLGPEIGSGGMGAVHRAWDERFEREVAIKVVRSGSVEKERLRREAQYLAHLDHPNLVAVLDAGADRLRSTDTVWFAMELVNGPDLRTVLHRDGPLGGAVVRKVLIGVLAALDALHVAGVVHRDLKPANVLLTGEPASARWEVKLVDLGIAQHVRTDHLTSTGQVVGTAAYLSPEQVGGRPIGPATDVYALGLLAIEALSGRIAFPGRPAESAAARLVRSPDLPAGLGPAWRSTLMAMTELDPALRPSVGVLTEMVRALPDAVEDTAGADVPTRLMPLPQQPEERTAVLPAAAPAAPRRTRRERRRRHVLAGGSVLLVVVAAGGWVAALSGGIGTAADAATSAPAPSAPRPSSTAVRPSSTPTPAATSAGVRPTATPSTVPTGAAASTGTGTKPVLPSGWSRPQQAHRLDDAARRFTERLERRLHDHQGHR